MDYIPLVLGLVMGTVTSYTDIRTGFIDDLHVFPIAGLGIAYYLYKGFSVEHSTILAFSGVIAFLIGLLLGLLLYFIGAWASGDVVVLAGFSALLPYAPLWGRVVPPYTVSYPLYPVSILLNSIIAVFPFIFLYSLGVILIRRQYHELVRIFTDGAKLTAEVALWITAGIGFQIVMAKSVGWVFGGLWGWVFALVVITLLGKFRKAGDVVGAITLAYLVHLNPLTGLLLFGKLLLMLYMFKVFLATVKYMRASVLMEEVPVEALKEWDILGETIYEDEERIKRDRTSLLDRVKDAVTRGDIASLKGQHGRVIVSTTAEGLNKEQIERLKALVTEGKLENRFLRKKAMPFAPALFLGFLISYLWGDIFWWIELKLAGM
ncbi:A24 family peptidase C-terminal domain-containing protein [Thermococcus sp.]|uniref:A24 family peptidase C-terminal domain-containing protein n=1 Tax=Thermococcus sp. TaxID=35749 RepID=UPI00262AA479|nr:A24 family peptidase C-terminal domain-containing protein [Thermococcus sp.]